MKNHKPKKMKAVKTNITKIHPNPSNPRVIKDDKFKKLVKSIKDFPKMLEVRPIVVDKDYIVLGGNMRLRACQEAGLKEVPVIVLDNFTEKEQREFIIKDNVGYGEWDWDLIANEWDIEQLEDWGLDIPSFSVEDEVKTSDYVANRDLDTMLETYNNASIKQIVLYYELEEYEYLLRKLDDIGKERDLEDNSSVVKYLVDKYLANESSNPNTL